MRGDKKTKALAKQLFKLSLVNGAVSPEQVAGVLGYIEKVQPRHSLALLKLYHRAIVTEVAKSRAIVEHACDQRPPSDVTAACPLHGDLAARNILSDRGRLVGVIDWSDS